jgi:hypothetical protein
VLTQRWENKLGHDRSIWQKPSSLDDSVLTMDLQCLRNRGEESFRIAYELMIETCRAKIANGGLEPEETATIASGAAIRSSRSHHQASLSYRLVIGDCSVKKDELLLYNMEGDQIDPETRARIKDGRGRSLGCS